MSSTGGDADWTDDLSALSGITCKLHNSPCDCLRQDFPARPRTPSARYRSLWVGALPRQSAARSVRADAPVLPLTGEHTPRGRMGLPPPSLSRPVAMGVTGEINGRQTYGKQPRPEP